MYTVHMDCYIVRYITHTAQQKTIGECGKTTILAQETNIQTSNTFHLGALSLYSRLLFPNKRTKYMCSWKGDHLKGCLLINNETVWHYSNCSERPYLSLLDNTMFKCWYNHREQRPRRENFCILSQKKRGIACFVIWWIWTEKNTQDKGRNNKRSAAVFISAQHYLPFPQGSSLAWKTSPFVLCVSLMTLFMTTGEEMFLRGTWRKPTEDKIIKQDIGNSLQEKSCMSMSSKLVSHKKSVCGFLPLRICVWGWEMNHPPVSSGKCSFVIVFLRLAVNYLQSNTCQACDSMQWAED